MDAQLKARVEAALKVPAVVAGGLLGDLRLLYEHATAAEAEGEQLAAALRQKTDEADNLRAATADLMAQRDRFKAEVAWLADRRADVVRVVAEQAEANWGEVFRAVGLSLVGEEDSEPEPVSQSEPWKVIDIGGGISPVPEYGIISIVVRALLLLSPDWSLPGAIAKTAEQFRDDIPHHFYTMIGRVLAGQRSNARFAIPGLQARRRDRLVGGWEYRIIKNEEKTK